MATPSPQRGCEIQPLEARRLLAQVTPLNVFATIGTLGNILTIQGTSGDDRISITYGTSGFVIGTATGWSTTYGGPVAQLRIDAGGGNDRVEIASTIRTDAVLYGGGGIDTLIAGGGNDSLYGGDGRDYLYGQGGSDVIVALGDGALDRLYGGGGNDSFWVDTGSGEMVIDASVTEMAAGAVHAVGGFMPLKISGATYSIPMTLFTTAPALVDPTFTSAATRYERFSDRPLFSRLGPRPDDIYQGSIGDCYLLASLGSVAHANAEAIRQRVVDLGDGTYAVQFTSAGSTVYVRVDGDLPVNTWGLSYARLGRQGALWAAIFEKAYAFFRYNQGSYASLDSGFMGDVYTHLGFQNTSQFSTTSATSLLQRLQADLAAGKAVTFGTRPDVGDAPITGSHAYMVDSVITDAAGTATHLRLRNPWGIDDTAGHGTDDGYILLTAAQALRAFWFACAATVR